METEGDGGGHRPSTSFHKAEDTPSKMECEPVHSLWTWGLGWWDSDTFFVDLGGDYT